MTSPPTAPGFLFPGQLSELVGMGRDFYDADPEARRLFAWTSERCGRDLERLVFEGPLSELAENLAAQLSVHLVSTLAPRGGVSRLTPSRAQRPSDGS